MYETVAQWLLYDVVNLNSSVAFLKHTSSILGFRLIFAAPYLPSYKRVPDILRTVNYGPILSSALSSFSSSSFLSIRVHRDRERERENSRNFSLKHGGDKVIYETSHPTMLLSMTCSLYGHFLTLSNVTLR